MSKEALRRIKRSVEASSAAAARQAAEAAAKERQTRKAPGVSSEQLSELARLKVSYELEVFHCAQADITFLAALGLDAGNRRIGLLRILLRFPKVGRLRGSGQEFAEERPLRLISPCLCTALLHGMYGLQCTS